jgi:hypothetical protein
MTTDFQITDSIFGMPEILIDIQKLEKLTIRNASQVSIVTEDSKCLQDSTVEIKIEGLDNGLLSLPCVGNNSKINLINPLNQPVEYR